MHMHRPNIRTK